MRHVIYILLIVNLMYFSWNVLQNNPHERGENPVRHMPDNVRRLETIQERAVKSAAVNAESARDTPGATPVAAGTPESTVPREHARTQPDTADISRVEALTALEPPGAVVPSPSCHALGPFRDEKEMKAVENRLNQLGYTPRGRAGEARFETGYWVYLPAMEREEVLRITRMLDEKNDRDYLIVKGNALSLGAYDSRSRADLRLGMLRKYGLDPVVEPRYAMRAAYWLDLELPDDGRAVLDAIRGEYQNMEAQESACL